MQRASRRLTWVVAGATFAFVALFSVVEYWYLRDRIFGEGLARAHLVITAVESVQSYVREVLRPKLREVLPPHAFLPEGMSTTFVSRRVAERMLGKNPDYYFKFAALEPRNPLNEADEFERRMIARFQGEPGLGEWRGAVRRPSGEALVYLSPIRVEASCLECHGLPGDAPKRLIELYGDERGFGRREGDIAGLRSVAIPIGVPLAEARRMLLWNSLLACGGVLLLFVGTGWIFRRQVAAPLETLEGYARRIGEGEGAGDPPALPDNEIAVLGRTLALMHRQVLEKAEDAEARNRELRVARDELEAAHAYLERLVHALPEGIVALGDDGYIEDVNAAACDLLEIRREDVLGRPCAELFASWENTGEPLEALCPVRRVLDGPGQARYVMHLRSSRDERFLEVTANLLAAGPSRLVIAVLRDATDAVRGRAVIEEKSAELESFVHALGHDLRAPLANINSFVQLMQEGGIPASQSPHVLERMRFNADVMSRLIADLLELSRIGIRPEPPEDIASADVAREALRLLETKVAAKGAQVVVQEGLPRLRYPRNRLLQVFSNLVDNALEHAGAEGRLRIELGHSAGEQKGEHTFWVRDNGAGIDPTEAEAVFLPFVSRTKKRTGSSGLGLTIVRRIVEQNGGRVWVDSLPGRGATFYFTAPA